MSANFLLLARKAEAIAKSKERNRSHMEAGRESRKNGIYGTFAKG
jgi:hypothetical protein